MIPKTRTERLNRLLRRMERSGIPYTVVAMPWRNGYQVISYDRHRKHPLASTIIDDLSIGGVADFFETGVYDEYGDIHDVTGWQTIDEVIDTIRSAM